MLFILFPKILFTSLFCLNYFSFSAIGILLTIGYTGNGFTSKAVILALRQMVTQDASLTLNYSDFVQGITRADT